MRSRTMIRGLIGLAMVAITAFAASAAYYHESPARAIEGVWESTSYFEVNDGEYMTRSKINIDGRNLNGSALIYDSNNHITAKREVKMRLNKKAWLSRSNIFTVETDYPRPFPPSKDPAIENQLYIFNTMQPRLYLLDCNQLIMDSSPGPRLGYTTIYKRSIPITCD